MKHQAKVSAASALISALFLPLINVHADDHQQIALSISGKFGWSVECQWTDHKGRDKSARKRSRGATSNAKLILSDYMSGHCRVETNDKGSVQLMARSMGKSTFCPFEAKESACGIRFGGGQNVQVDLKAVGND